MLYQSSLLRDGCATCVATGIVLSLLHLWEETSRRQIFDQKVNRKLVHISVGLVFILSWPLFSAGIQGAIFAATIPCMNVVRMFLIGIGIWKNQATVKCMTRFGDHRELLRGPLYYALAITLACAIYWRTSPVAVAVICNLCAGDGVADIVGRRYGHRKIPYNRNKTFAGSTAMILAGFAASIAMTEYLSWYGYLQSGIAMPLRFLAVSVASAFVESLPLCTGLDDNLTVPLASALLGAIVF